MPKHIGLILDGNRRWAKKRGIPQLEGHRRGLENLEAIGDVAWDEGVEYLSAYIFSTENWNREKDEVVYLMNLLTSSVASSRYINKLNKNGVKAIVVGSRERLSRKVLDTIDKLEEKTNDNKKGVLALHFNYGGQREITDAIKAIVSEGTDAQKIDEKVVSEHMYHPELPPADLIIRTSGEKRLSNFMLWRAAYSELYFSDKYWPDFSAKDFNEVLKEYSKRQRRIGK